MRKGDDFTLEDFKDQLAQVKNMGSFSSLIEKLPAQFAQAAGQVDDEQAKKQLARTEAIINSMTPHERRKPESSKQAASAESLPAPAPPFRKSTVCSNS